MKSVYYEEIFTPGGNASYVSPYNCKKNSFIMGSDNGGIYNYNLTGSLVEADNNPVNFALVDLTNNFLAFGKKNQLILI